MRDWRKIHKGILESDRLASVSDAAFRLYVYLLVLQDDAGEYPWTRPWRRRLTQGCGWSEQTIDRLGRELVEHGLVTLDEDHLVIDRGAEMNGRPAYLARGRQSMYYRPDMHPNLAVAYTAHTRMQHGADAAHTGMRPDRDREEIESRGERESALPPAMNELIPRDLGPWQEVLDTLAAVPTTPTQKPVQATDYALIDWAQGKGHLLAEALESAMYLKGAWRRLRYSDVRAAFQANLLSKSNRRQNSAKPESGLAANEAGRKGGFADAERYRRAMAEQQRNAALPGLQ